MLDVVWDMETNDPDDFLTLLWLLGHPDVNLKAVTVLPGSPQQIGLVRHAVNTWFQVDIPIGAHNMQSPKPRVSPWHYDAFGSIPPSENALPAAEVLLDHCDSATTLITGAALTNLRSAIRVTQSTDREFKPGRLFVQGGFAGQGVVPPELQLEKFKGLVTAPTHNLMQDKKAAEMVLAYEGFERKYFVSKNVCHRVIYDHTLHKRFAELKDRNLAFTLIWQGMEDYLRTNPAGKMLHDPLTACCALDPGIGTWREVELFREGNAWGARLAPESGTRIIIDYDHARFLQVLTAL